MHGPVVEHIILHTATIFKFYGLDVRVQRCEGAQSLCIQYYGTASAPEKGLHVLYVLTGTVVEGKIGVFYIIEEHSVLSSPVIIQVQIHYSGVGWTTHSETRTVFGFGR